MNDHKRTAMVIGATGSFGGAVTREMVGRGWKVRALVRDVDEARSQLADVPGVELVEGDALVKEDVVQAARGVDVLVDSFNVAYPDWDPLTIESAQIVAEVASEQELLVLFPGNVYGLGSDFSQPLDESAPHESPTKKGEIRNRIERIFEGASHRGARFVILRCGDFFGPNAPESSSWFSIMTKKALDGGAIVYPSDSETVHQWAYLPDAAHTAVDLVELADAFDSFEVFHFGGHAVTPREMTDAIGGALGDPHRKVKGFMWWAVWLAKPFSRFMRELYEMRYLWDEPVVLDDTKLRATLREHGVDEVAHTPLDEAVAQSLTSMASRAAASRPRATESPQPQTAS
jgi:nucleoside-diphosphate-sugar epimerase